MSDGNARVEQAWIKLAAWAEEWYHRDERGCFVGTMGGSPASEVLFPNVSLEAALALTRGYDIGDSISSCERTEDGRTVEVPLKDFDAFESACRESRNRQCTFFAPFVNIPLRDGDLEASIGLERVSETSVDLRIVWSPHLAFFNAPDLKERFTSIFQYFFEVESVLKAGTLMFTAGSIAARGEVELRIEL